MVYFDGLSRHPCLPYARAKRIAVPMELVYDDAGDVPGWLDETTDDAALESWGLVFGELTLFCDLRKRESLRSSWLVLVSSLHDIINNTVASGLSWRGDSCVKLIKRSAQAS